MIQEAIGDLIGGVDLGRARTRAVMDQIMSAKLPTLRSARFSSPCGSRVRRLTRSSVAPKSCARKLRR